MGLCLGAVFAITAMYGAVAAQALPEVGRCVAVVNVKDKYTDPNCNVKAVKGNGKFEFKKGIEGKAAGFESTSGAAELETESKSKVSCTASKAKGKWDEDTGAIKEVENVTAEFSGCELPLLSVSCNTVGKGTGEISTHSLKGPLGYIVKSTKDVGQELTPETKKGKFAEFECGAGSIKIVVGEGAVNKGGHNCLIAPVTPVNSMGLAGNETYSAKFNGTRQVQNPQNFEAKPLCELESASNGGPAEFANQTQSNNLVFETEAEVRG
jgi:hypothetical protein